jgi:hypothetical protein
MNLIAPRKLIKNMGLSQYRSRVLSNCKLAAVHA